MKVYYLKKENGVALIAAVGAIAVLMILAFGLLTYTQNAVEKVIEYRHYVKAINLADAGVDHVTWLYKKRSLPENYIGNKVTLDFGQQGRCDFKVEGGDVGFEKEIISVGYLPTGEKKAVKVTLFSMNIWDMMLSAGNENPDRRPGGSGGIEGNGMIQGPFYIRGNLPVLLGTFDIYEGPLFINDGSLIKGSSSGYVGEETSPITAYIEGNEEGAIFRKQGNKLEPLDPWTPSMNIYIEKLKREVPDIEFPALTQDELNRLYDVSKDEGSDNILPSYPETASTVSFDETQINPSVRTAFSVPEITNYKVLDNDSFANGSLATQGKTIYIGGSESFGLVDADGDGDIDNSDSSYYEFAYNASQKKLYIRGTVFVDGNLVFSDNVTYEGRGTFIVNGNCNINGKLLTSSDFPQTNSLGLAVKGDCLVDVDSSNDVIDDIQVAVFTEGDVAFSSNNTRFYGAMIAGFIDMSSANNIQLVLANALPSNLPPSLPASESNIVTIIGWKEIAVPSGF